MSVYKIIFCFLLKFSLSQAIPIQKEPKTLTCSLCERHQNEILQTYHRNETDFIALIEKTCLLIGPPETCGYYINTLGKNSIEHTLDFLDQTNRLCVEFGCQSKFKEFSEDDFQSLLAKEFPELERERGPELDKVNIYKIDICVVLIDMN